MTEVNQQEEFIDVCIGNGTNGLSLLRKQETRKLTKNDWIPAFMGTTFQ